MSGLAGAEPSALRTPLSGAITTFDPRLRIVLAVLSAIVVVALSDRLALALALGGAVGLLFFSGLPLKVTLKRMAGMDGFILFMLIMLPFTVPGTPVFTLWGFDASREGVLQAIDIALTANAVILALMCLVGSMEAVAMGHALNALHVPKRLVQLLMFTIRYIAVLRGEYARLRAAMKLRGFRPGTNWHTYRSYGYLVGMMLVRAVERSERILGAMKCRGFDGRFVLLQGYALRRSDWIFAGCFVTILLALVLVEFRHALD